MTAVTAAEASSGPSGSPASRPLRAAGWMLHTYTASGTAIAFGALVATVAGNEVLALWLLFAALVVDGTDGLLARRLRVSQTIPGFDGARLDDIVDYITYCFVPVFMLWNGGYLPEGAAGAALAVAPLLASSYQFCRVDAKTDDNCFLGFPSYWNVVALYVIVLGLSDAAVAAILLVCAVLVFVPVKYLYPSKTKVHRVLNLLLAGAWLVTYALMLVQYPDPHPAVVAVSLAYVVYYVGASLWMTVRNPHRAARGATTG